MVTEPESMEQLVSHTLRALPNDGTVRLWVYKQDCPKCKKAKMGKPRDPKTNKPKIRAKEYVCPECGYTIEKKEYEDTLVAEAVYKCPDCGKNGEWTGPFKRKTIQGAPTIRVVCQHCGGFIDVTKKFKEKKVKKK